MHYLLTDRIATPIGKMVLVARDKALLILEFVDAEERAARELRQRFGAYDLKPTPNPFGFSAKVCDYFNGDLNALDGLLTDGGGTAFEEQVWRELKKIPCGNTVSYGEIAQKLGDIKLSRAVGAANGKNPISLAVPCHRVIGSDGKLTGYGGGLHRKKWLLKHEGALLI
jgi:methylated-DNA-[protein]-cysteine S-methyltransferase